MNKRYFTSIIMLFFVLYSGCEKSMEPTAATPSGSVSFYFGKAPANVAHIIARLTRRDYDERVLELTVGDTGSSAYGSLRDVAVGTWHLNVDATDDSGKVKYSGETDIEVIGGQVTQVSLELSATTGDVEIVVTWGGSCVPVPSGLVSWWPGDGNANDRTGINDGLLVDSAVFTEGKVGRAFEFDGAHSYVRIPSTPSLNPSGSFSIETWIYPMKDTLAMILAKWGWYAQWSNQRSYSLDLLPGGNLNFGIANDSLQWDLAFQDFRTTTGPISFNTWNHVAIVYDQPAGARRIYVNGAKIRERVDPPITITNSIADLCIGAYHFAPSYTEMYFKGKVDEIGFYNRALTAAEIAAIHQAGSNGRCR